VVKTTIAILEITDGAKEALPGQSTICADELATEEHIKV
jgi:hypothetical protein